jgi:hypothetical protein
MSDSPYNYNFDPAERGQVTLAAVSGESVSLKYATRKLDMGEDLRRGRKSQGKIDLKRKRGHGS